MKYLLGVLVFAFVLLTACAPHAPPRARDVTTVTVTQSRTVDVTLHADVSFTDAGRAKLERAAKQINVLTHGRANVGLVFDLDFDSVSGLKTHVAASHSMLVGVTSELDITAQIDSLMAAKCLQSSGCAVQALTIQDKGSPQVLVFLVLDRILTDDFETIVTHEFGHVVGFPDLDRMGSIMSGVSVKGRPLPKDWTPADVALCREYGLCD